jgi:outer membrane receptor protein involved in Fe transport
VLANIASTVVRAFDFQADYTREINGLGIWHAFLLGTYEPKLARRNSRNAAPVEYAGRLGGPMKWQGNFGLDWTKGALTAGWTAQFVGRMNVCGPNIAVACNVAIARQGSERIRGAAYHDIFVRYKLDGLGFAGIRNADVMLGVQNVFNKEPPIIVATGGASYGTSADPRLRRFTLALKQHF